MSVKLRPYTEYKDPGVPWLGRVPSDWDVVRLKHASDQIVCGATPASSAAENWDGDIVWATPADVGKSRWLRDSQRQITDAGLASCSARLVPRGSIILTCRAPIGGVALAAMPLCTSQGCKSIIPNASRLHSVFGFYLMGAMKHHLQSLGSGTTFPEISTDVLAGTEIPIPPLHMQRQIAAFLTRVDLTVRRLIRAKHRQIELLNEQKQGIIAQMLTGKSESAVSRKSSGADWLGDVPSHWDIVPLKHLSRWIQNGTTPPTSERRYYDNGTIPWFGPSSIGDEFSAGTPVRLLAEEAFRDGKARLIHGPALLVVVIGATAGKSALLPGIGSSNQQLTAYELRRDRVVPEFVAYQVRMTEKWLRSSASTATIPILDTYTVSGLPIAVPPLVEQMAIVDEVNRALKPLSATIDLMHQQVALLREYRTRLIADVVTGKLDVSNVELPDSDGAGLLADGVCDADFVSDLDDDEPSDTEEVEADAED